jgi:hypothetical protein
MRSPSQWPGTARSVASPGRASMLVIPAIRAPGLDRRPRGRRVVRPERSRMPRAASSPLGRA